MNELDFIVPEWPAPAGVRAIITTRRGGVSGGPFASLNLGDHVGDDAEAVAANRVRVAASLHLPGPPMWLEQVHGTAIARYSRGSRPRADAALARAPGEVCAVLTADCLPVLLAHRAGTVVGVAHAGWRGLAAGVIERTVEALAVEPASLMAWLGPAIGPEAFEVGEEVREQFIAADPAAVADFRPGERGRWLADIFSLARRRLAACGVSQVAGGGQCTVADPGRFFSYRRDGMTGRMAALIWME